MVLVEDHTVNKQRNIVNRTGIRQCAVLLFSEIEVSNKAFFSVIPRLGRNSMHPSVDNIFKISDFAALQVICHLWIKNLDIRKLSSGNLPVRNVIAKPQFLNIVPSVRVN